MRNHKNQYEAHTNTKKKDEYQKRPKHAKMKPYNRREAWK